MRMTVHENFTIKPGTKGLNDLIDELIEIDKHLYHADWELDNIAKLKTPIQISGYRYATEEELESMEKESLFEEGTDYYET